ncbi:MAG TPA: hypothetical protein VFN35_01455, partial [Ktedonobacteraceae bacterium]|nr:hypothetical protein [Ktedonobacteraceae bacterium]
MHEKKAEILYSNLEMTGTGGVPLSIDEHSAIESALPDEITPNQTNRWVVFALAASTSFITTLDGSIVNIGLPLIAQTFHIGVGGA